MIIQRYIEFKQKQDNLFGSYAIIPMNLCNELENKNGFLSKKEQDILRKMNHKNRIRSFCAGRFAAKKAIKLINPDYISADISIVPGILENPVILSDYPLNLNISISHSQSFSFAVVTSPICPVGVDTEVILKENQKEYLALSTKHEILLTMNIFQEDELTAAARLWALKESLSKTIKCGLTIPLKLLEIISFDEELKSRCVFKNFPQYRATSFTLNGSIFAICLPYSINIYDNF